MTTLTRTELRALIMLMVLVAAVVMAMAWDQFTGPRWDCAAEDEYVRIGNVCEHADTIRSAMPAYFGNRMTG